jgi:eukaryotic-like serine/threonine-protein kinase
MEILDAEHVSRALPPDYAAIRRRIEHVVRADPEADPGTGFAVLRDETRLQTSRGFAPVQTPRGNVSQAASASASAAERDQAKGVGETLNNRFVLEECLGIGGMGTVYKALDLRKLEAADWRPYVAIKVLNLRFRGNPRSLI